MEAPTTSHESDGRILADAILAFATLRPEDTLTALSRHVRDDWGELDSERPSLFRRASSRRSAIHR
jgi:hypothetical protein